MSAVHSVPPAEKIIITFRMKPGASKQFAARFHQSGKRGKKKHRIRNMFDNLVKKYDIV